MKIYFGRMAEIEETNLVTDAWLYDKLQTYNNPTGLRDNEILENVWRKWAKDSEFKDITWDKY